MTPRPGAPRLRLMCGLAGSGKSTYARRLEAQGWLRFSIDREAWQQGYVGAPLPTDVAADIRARQRGRILEALRAGRDVVVDYSFWARSQRDDYRALGRGAGAEVDVVHLHVPEEVLRERLAARGGEHADEMLVGAELLASYLEGFEFPEPDEDDVTVLGVSGRRPG